MELLCKIFGHRIDYKTLDTHRMTSLCKWCDKKLKVSYDMSYGQTIVTGDYGNQGTFCWCHCGNELCSSNSYVDLMNDINRFEYFKCSVCGRESKWDFDAPCPILIESSPNTQ